MKKLLFLMTLVFSSLAHAGSSDQDPVIAQLRNQYAESKRPTAEQLVSHEWNCDNYDAWKDNFEKLSFRIQFQAGPGKLIKALGGYGEKTYVFSDSALVRTDRSKPRNGQQFATVNAWRITNDGLLIGEGALDNTQQVYDDSPDKALTPGYQQYTASSYKICQ